MSNKVLIIAEAGINHNGSIEIAKKLIDVAKEAKADIVKFQTFVADSLVTKKAKKANYQIENYSNGNDSQFEMLKNLELSKGEFKTLSEHSAKKGIKFISTGFDIESLYFLNELGIDLFKIPSGEITNLPYLRTVAKFGKPTIMSSGMSSMQEVKNAYNILRESGLSHKKITILHCNTLYPTPFSEVNLNAMKTIQKELNVSIGFSDHTAGIEIAIAAVALGARVIEKHFTLDKNLVGPDHKASLDPLELKKMVSSIRNVEKSLGSSLKTPSNIELQNINIVRKSIVAKRKIEKGERFTEKNITVKRPGNGISPMMWDCILGEQAKKNYDEDDLI